MAFNAQIESGIALVTLAGELTVADMAAVAKWLDLLDRTMAVSPHRLYDISAVEELQINFTELHQHAATRRAVRLHNDVKAAVVARTEVHYGVGRMFQILNEQPQVTIAVFRSFAEAREWLAGTPAKEDLPPSGARP